MSAEPSTTGPASTEIQFDKAEIGAGDAAPHECGICSTPLRGHYYQVGNHATCERCRYEVEAALEKRGGAAGFFRALAFGLGGGIAGAAVYYAVLALFNLEISLLSILVGWLVGTGVHKGSRGKGGWVYQTLAVGLTYLCIVSTYVPMILKAIGEQAGKEKSAASAPAPRQGGGAVATAPGGNRPAGHAAPSGAKEANAGDLFLAAGLLLAIAAAAPFLQGARSLLGLLIIGIGLYQAWTLNRRREVVIAGPFRIGTAPTAPVVPTGGA